MSRRVHVRLCGISQEAEFRIGGTGNRLGNGFVPASSPFTTGQNRFNTLMQAWNPGIITSWERARDMVDGWCAWGGTAASNNAACFYDVATDTFGDTGATTNMQSLVAAQFAAHGSNPDFWLFFGLWVRTNWNNTGVVAPTDALQRRLVAYLAGRMEAAWVAAGGSLSRFRFIAISQRNVIGGTSETWRKFRVMNGVGGLDPNGPVARIDRVVVPHEMGVGNPDGVHNWESENQRMAEAAAAMISREVGAANLLGAGGVPRFGRWWKTSATTAVIPLFHGNGARAMVPVSPPPAFRFTTNINTGGDQPLTVDSVDTSQAATGRTLFTVSNGAGIPDTCWLTNNEGSGGTLSEVFVDYTPGGSWTRADWNSFTDIYTAVSPSIIRPMVQQVPIALANPNEAWDGTRDAHPLGGGGSPSAVLTEAVDLGNGTIRARFAASGGVSLIRVSLRRLADNVVLSTVLLPITTAAEHSFTGLVPSAPGYRVEYAWRRSATVGVTVT